MPPIFPLSVLESPRKPLGNGDFRLNDMNGGEESIWPSTETRPPTSDYGDTVSVADYGGHGNGVSPKFRRLNEHAH